MTLGARSKGETRRLLRARRREIVATRDLVAEQGLSGKDLDKQVEAGKKQYLIPYFIAAHPGTTDADMLNLALWLKKNDYRADQVQTFLPSPMATLAPAGWNPKTPCELLQLIAQAVPAGVAALARLTRPRRSTGSSGTSANRGMSEWRPSVCWATSG